MSTCLLKFSKISFCLFSKFKFATHNPVFSYANITNVAKLNIHYTSSEENKKRACNRIMKTALSTMLDVPFNADYLITSECNVDSIQLYANKISDVDPTGNEEIAKWED